MKGRMAGAIIGALLGVGCAIFAWLTIAVQTGNAALAIIAIVGTLIIGGSMIVLVRDYGDDLDEREALKGEIVTRLQRLEFPLNLLSSLLEHQDWAVRYESASMLGHSHNVRAVKPLIEVMMKDQSTSVQRAASSALERIGTAEALAAAETWRLEKGVESG